MTIEVKVPVLPESVEDASIASWHKKPGDTIRRDENLVDLETDKVVLEVPAPADGTVKELLFEVGDVVNSDDVIAVLEEGIVEDATPAEEPAESQPEPAPAKETASAAAPWAKTTTRTFLPVPCGRETEPRTI